MKEMIRAQETLLLTRAEGHLARLEEEITLLRKKHNDLEQLSQSDDHIHFLQVLLKSTVAHKELAFSLNSSLNNRSAYFLLELAVSFCSFWI